MTSSNSVPVDDFEPDDDFVVDDFEPDQPTEEESRIKAAGQYATPVKTPEEIRKMSIQEKMEYAEDLERERQYRFSKGYTKGVASGATFGLSENIDALKPQEGELGGTAGKITGELLPLVKINKIFAAPLVKLASKSPAFQSSLTSIAHITGAAATGATAQTLNTLTKGDMPTVDEVVRHGAEWGLLDAGLQALGIGGRFAASLLKKAKITGKTPAAELNETFNKMREQGVEVTRDARTAAKALEILEEPAVEDLASALDEASLLDSPARLPGDFMGKPINTKRNAVDVGIRPEPIPNAESTGVSLKNSPESPVESLSKERFTQEPTTPQDLSTKKVTFKDPKEITKQAEVLSEPYQPKDANYTAEADALGETALENRLAETAPRAGTLDELGTSIKSDVEASLEAAKEEYKPLYEIVDNAADDILHVPQNTARVAGDNFFKIRRVKTGTAAYGSVKNTIETALDDAGYEAVLNEKGQIEQFISTKPVPVSKTIELARRLNDIANYEAIEPSVRDVVKKMARAAKTDIRTALASNPDALAAFELAEEAYGITAAKFGRDSIRRIRQTQAGETVAGMTKSPTTLADLKEVTSAAQYAQIEREVLESINALNYNQASKTFREVGKQLSESNRQLAKEIVEAKNPFNPAVKTKKIQEGILQDLTEAFNTGTRPEKALRMWRTPKGQQMVRDTFKGSPNWKEVKGYLEKQTFNDMVASVIGKNGKIDKKSLREFMKDPAAVNNIRQMGGDEAVTFFRGMEENINSLEKGLDNLNRLFNKDKSAIGKDILNAAKRRNIAVQEGKQQVSNVGQKSIQTERKLAKEYAQQKKEYGTTKGEKTLEEASERALPKKRVKETAAEPLATQRAESQRYQGLKENKVRTRGDEILERMVSKDYNLLFKANKLEDWFKETMGLNVKAALSVFSLMKLGVPDAIVTLIGYKLFNKFIKNSKARSLFKQASKKNLPIVPFMIAIQELADELED